VFEAFDRVLWAPFLGPLAYGTISAFTLIAQQYFEHVFNYRIGLPSCLPGNPVPVVKVLLG